MNISVFGMGYVGCICLGCLAKAGHYVVGVDINKSKVDHINKGKSTIIENEIDKIIHEQWQLQNLSATNDPYKAVLKTNVSLVCVGTPSTTNGHLNINSIFNVANEIAKAIMDKNDFHVVVIRSTVLPGTNEKVANIIENVSQKKNGINFSVVSNPEFLREGSAVNDFYTPPYTLVGSNYENSIKIMKKIYAKIDAPFIITEPKTAEILKYVNNAFHALKITFANEIGNICKGIGINSQELMDIFCSDTKLNISNKYLRPGFSYGGSCLPKDLKALRTIAHDLYLECPVLENIERSNEKQKDLVLNNILKLNKKKIGFIGISFKEGTDDLRNSPIIDIIEKLIGKGYEITIFDKNVRMSQLIGANKDFILQKIPYISKFIIEDINALVDSSEIIVIVNNEDEFKKIYGKIPNDKLIYDLVNINNFKKRQNYLGISW